MNQDNKLKSNNYPRQILGIFGDSSSGKETMVNYLKAKYSYEIFNYLNIDNEGINLQKSEALFKGKPPSQKVKEIINDMSKMKICFYPLLSEGELDLLLTKAAFKVVYITSSIKKRFENYKKKHDGTNKGIEDFITEDYIESSSSYLIKVRAKTNFTINNQDTLEELYSKIDEFIVNTNQFRPNWDDYFMKIAQGVEQRCNCAKTKIGAIITKDNRIVSVGYNGTASKIGNCYKGECPRCWSNLRSGEDLDKCICIHAEENALLEAGRKKCIGGKIYSTVLPCLTCAKHIIQCGITEVVYDGDYDSSMTRQLFEIAGVKLIKWKPAIKSIF